VQDSIYALATPPGAGAVAIIRISGPHTKAVLAEMAGTVPKPRVASLRRLSGVSGRTIDEGLVLWFPGPGSYTGEDMAELQVHGSRAVISDLLEKLSADGLRLANPGEFTRRAFVNGKLSLTQAEAVADLIEAETEAQATQARSQLAGQLDLRYRNWRDQLLEALGYLEAAVDFPDEELPAELEARVEPILSDLIDQIQSGLATSRKGRAVREGYRIALVGQPNAGKSSLYNGLLGRRAAIVADVAGTTRDVLEAPLDLGGFRVLLSDTAGLRDTTDQIEAQGIELAQVQAGSADLRLWLRRPEETEIGLEPEGWTEGDLTICSFRDTGAEPGFVHDLWLDTRSGEDINALVAQLTNRVRKDLGSGEFPVATRQRHQDAMSQALEHLMLAATVIYQPELASSELHQAVRCLERVVGRIEPDMVLDGIFGRFCIGK
jgi:tRNA modification GTPase